jgi:glutamate--cysteine ligase
MPNTMTHRQSELLLNRLDALSSGPTRQHLPDGLRGIEKESLRVTRDGMIAFTPHPRALGSALTHPSLTTDYSEALIELITPAESDASLTLARLDDLHRYVQRVARRRDVWNESMPGRRRPTTKSRSPTTARPTSAA